MDFIDKCIEWKPEKRMQPAEAFEHPWIQAGLQELKPKILAAQKAEDSATQY